MIMPYNITTLRRSIQFIGVCISGRFLLISLCQRQHTRKTSSVIQKCGGHRSNRAVVRHQVYSYSTINTISTGYSSYNAKSEFKDRVRGRAPSYRKLYIDISHGPISSFATYPGNVPSNDSADATRVLSFASLSSNLFFFAGLSKSVSCLT
eukprot:COSAG02_NODE_6929_length_3283_cov_3.394786_1_plen_151_part_00